MTHTKTEVIRTIIMLPVFPLIFIVGILEDDIDGVLRFYYPLFY